MRRLGTDEWAGLAVLVVVLGIAVPILFGVLDTSIPVGWWAVLFLLYASGLAVPMLEIGRMPVRYLAFGIAVLASWALVASAPGLGLVVALVVVTAALSVYLVPLPASLALVLANTVFVGWALAWAGSSAVEVTLVTGFYLLIQAATVLSTATMLRERRMRLELALAHAELKAASFLLGESARTSERLRISRDLHDQVGHHLTVLALELEAARHRPSEEARVHVDRAATVARDLLREVRETVGDLREHSPDLREGLTRMTSDIPGLDIRVRVDPQARSDEAGAATLLQVAQEVLTNTLRHAEAGRLTLVVTDEAGVTVLDARDDGRGAGRIVPGHGLTGLRERVEAVGGEVEFDGSDGFRVTARVPS